MESNAVLTGTQMVWNGHSSGFWGCISRKNYLITSAFGNFNTQTSIHFHKNAVLGQSPPLGGGYIRTSGR